MLDNTTELCARNFNRACMRMRINFFDRHLFLFAAPALPVKNKRHTDVFISRTKSNVLFSPAAVSTRFATVDSENLYISSRIFTAQHQIKLMKRLAIRDLLQIR